jgi:tetratricopeptide (TPR) repeat protein
MLSRYPAVVIASVLLLASFVYSQSDTTQQIQTITSAPLPVRVDVNLSPQELERRADELRAEKRYFDAADYYRAAIAKEPANAVLYNKLGINELLLLRFRQAKANFSRAIKLDKSYAAAYSNLGVVEYAQKKYNGAIKQYRKAISLVQDEAVYYSNLGTAYFSKKEWESSTDAYSRAISIDPNIFQATNQLGIAGRVASPEDRARFSYVLAELYAKNGMTDRSLECLRRAFEEGYKGVNDVYSDAAFTELRKDPRFTQLVASRPVSVSE